MNTHSHPLTWAALACSAFLLCACSEAPAPKTPAPAPIVQEGRLRFVADHPQLKLLPVYTVQTAHPVRADLPARLVWNEDRTQRIYPAFSGRVVSIKSDVGQKVSAGSALALLASPEFGQAQTEAARAQADAQLAQKGLARQRELFEAGIVARKELDQAEAEATRAQAELDRAVARTRLYGGSSSGGQGSAVNQQLALSSSISGVVVERNLNPGQELRPEISGPGVPALFVVTDPSSLWVQIDARESDLSLFEAQPQTALPFELSVAALPGQTFKAKVISSGDFVDPQSRTIKVRAIVANPDRKLKADMLATARFERSFAQGVMVPATAVMLRAGQHSVFVQTRAAEFERRRVQVMYEGPKEVILSSGLQTGEQVVVENALLLNRLLTLAQESQPSPALTEPKPSQAKAVP